MRGTTATAVGTSWQLPIAIAIAMLASGCGLRKWADRGFKVGPDYCRPAAPVASEWIDYREGAIKSEPADLSAWWTTLNDPVLDSLIANAYQQNLTLRVAGARILQAQAARGIAVGNMFPQVQQATGDFAAVQVSRKTAFVPPQIWFREWSEGLTASWELDFWGRFRRAVEVADAELDASIEEYDDVLVVLLADVSTSYVQMRIFQERLAYARQNVTVQEGILRIAEDRFRNGATTERDVLQAQQVLEQTRASIAELEIGLRQANNLLCILLGVPARDLTRELPKQPVPQVPPELAVGIPADLIRRRPDVRRAERDVAAQSARIGIATAEFYPQISLNGVIQVSAEDFGDLFDTPESVFGSVGPSVRWNILNYGRLLNNVRGQDARFEELVYRYQNQVLNAGREVEDAIVGYLRSQQQARHLAASVAAAARSVQIADEQYRQGAIDFTSVYLLESILASQQDQLAFARGNVPLNLIKVYRALGGGWEMRLSPPSAAVPIPPEAPAQPEKLPATPDVNENENDRAPVPIPEPKEA